MVQTYDNFARDATTGAILAALSTAAEAALVELAGAINANRMDVSGGLLTAAATTYEKLSVDATATGKPFAAWPASGRVTVIFTCETADVCWSPKTTVTTDYPILRVGDSVTLTDVDSTDISPRFIRLGSTSGEVRATFLVRV